ncbi:hypothetical protein G6F68_014420 [Rhizopus microsporus]|nr:hypothetical protein G6F68_014420 [Rhizopus microsporus]
MFVGLCAVAAYVLLGASWLVMRVDGDLQRRAAGWARHAIRWTAVGMVAIAVTLGLANAGIFYKGSNIAPLSLAATVWVMMLAGYLAAVRAVRGAVPADAQRPGVQPVPLPDPGRHDLVGRRGRAELDAPGHGRRGRGDTGGAGVQHPGVPVGLRQRARAGAAVAAAVGLTATAVAGLASTAPAWRRVAGSLRRRLRACARPRR